MCTYVYIYCQPPVRLLRRPRGPGVAAAARCGFASCGTYIHTHYSCKKKKNIKNKIK